MTRQKRLKGGAVMPELVMTSENATVEEVFESYLEFLSKWGLAASESFSCFHQKS